MSTQPANDSPAQLIQIAVGYWTSRLLFVAAKLELADRLAQAPRKSDDLAKELGLHARAFHRFMRSLAGMGILTEAEDRTFALTTLGQTLRKGAPGSARATVLTVAGPMFTQSWDRLLYSLETGKPGFDDAFGKPLFSWLAEHPEEASLFSETMVGFNAAEPPAVAAAYDFNAFESIADVGGATGNMLANILDRHRRPRAILFDLPHVVADAPGLIESRGLADRIRIESGSFFERVPQGHDAYILSHIIHDWSKDQCLSILANCRRAMDRNGRLLIVEMVLPEGDAPHPGKMLDMVMLVLPGGEERTATEYAALLARADFKVTRVIPTESAVSIVEAVPV